MKKIYYENQYIKEFESEIIWLNESGNKVILKETAFFPGGGGQWKDIGFINNIRVIDLIEEENDIIHVLEENTNLKVGQEVIGKIEWKNRKDGMEQHLGQHILSGSFYKILDKNTVSIHIGKDISTLDIIGQVNEEEVEEVLLFANSIIEDNRKVLGYFPENEEIKKLKLRRDLPVTDKKIRILEIEGLDLTACSGVHLASTLEVRLIKIKKVEKNKKNTRIYFLAGDRAVKDALDREKDLKAIEINLSSSGKETINSINNLKEEINNLKKDKRDLEEVLIDGDIKNLKEEIEDLNGIKLLIKEFNNKDIDYLRNLSNKIIKDKNTVLLLFNKQNIECKLILGRSKDLNDLDILSFYNENKDIISGKGGGSKLRIEVSTKIKEIDELIVRLKDEIKRL